MIDVLAFADKYRLNTAHDVCGELIIPGHSGHIFAYTDDLLGVLFMPDPKGQRKPSTAKWLKHKRNLSAVGCRIGQDGDGEGSAIFDPLNKEQATVAIRVAGCRRKRAPSAGQLAALAAVRARLQGDFGP